MKISIIMSLVVAATLFAPVAANAREGATRSSHGHHVADRHMAFAKATALYAPAPRSVAPSISDRLSTDRSRGDSGFTGDWGAEPYNH
jgi:hypothetical protein